MWFRGGGVHFLHWTKIPPLPHHLKEGCQTRSPLHLATSSPPPLRLGQGPCNRAEGAQALRGRIPAKAHMALDPFAPMGMGAYWERIGSCNRGYGGISFSLCFPRSIRGASPRLFFPCTVVGGFLLFEKFSLQMCEFGFFPLTFRLCCKV